MTENIVLISKVTYLDATKSMNKWLWLVFYFV